MLLIYSKVISIIIRVHFAEYNGTCQKIVLHDMNWAVYIMNNHKMLLTGFYSKSNKTQENFHLQNTMSNVVKQTQAINID